MREFIAKQTVERGKLVDSLNIEKDPFKKENLVKAEIMREAVLDAYGKVIHC